MTNIPNASPRDESTDHIPETGSDTPRHPFGMRPDWPAIVTDTLRRHKAKSDESNAAEVAEHDLDPLGLGLAALKAERPWITKVVVVRLMDELNADWFDRERIPAFLNYFCACRSGLGSNGLGLELVSVDDWSGNSALVAFPDERHAGDDYCLWQFERSTDWGSHGFEFLRLELVDDDGADTLSAKLGQAHDEWWAGYTPSSAADKLDEANRHNAELRAVIQRQGNRVDREHAGLVAQVTRLTAELDSANLYNNELRAIVAGRSNQVEDELDKALRVGANYRSKVAALTTDLDEAVALLEVVSAEADGYAARLKALRGAV
jgi:hypothetical protein